MDEETQAWCEANGLYRPHRQSTHYGRIRLHASYKGHDGRCYCELLFILCTTLSTEKSCSKAKSQSPPPLPPPVPTSTTKDANELANGLDVLESSILALAQQKDAPTESTKTGEGKPSKSIPRAHEAIYIKPRSGKSDSKVNPLDLTYSEFTAGYFSILDGLLQGGEHAQAQQLCRYLKFLSKKAIAFSTTAILQFDDEFRGMVARGEAAYDDHTSLNDLQAHTSTPRQ